MEQVDIVVLSPGVPTDIPMVNKLREAGACIIGEIELGYMVEHGSVVAAPIVRQLFENILPYLGIMDYNSLDEDTEA